MATVLQVANRRPNRGQCAANHKRRVSASAAANRSAAPHFGQRAVAEFRGGQHCCPGGVVAECQQHLGARTGRHRQARTDRDGIAKACRRFHRGDADPRAAFATVQLHALAGDLPQSWQNRRAGRQEWVVDLSGQLADRRAQTPTPLAVARQQPMNFQARGQSVCGGPGQPSAIA